MKWQRVRNLWFTWWLKICDITCMKEKNNYYVWNLILHFLHGVYWGIFFKVKNSLGYQYNVTQQGIILCKRVKIMFSLPHQVNLFPGAEIKQNFLCIPSSTIIINSNQSYPFYSVITTLALNLLSISRHRWRLSFLEIIKIEPLDLHPCIRGYQI
jgi:hypothetical protein